MWWQALQTNTRSHRRRQTLLAASIVNEVEVFRSRQRLPPIIFGSHPRIIVVNERRVRVNQREERSALAAGRANTVQRNHAIWAWAKDLLCCIFCTASLCITEQERI